MSTTRTPNRDGHIRRLRNGGTGNYAQDTSACIRACPHPSHRGGREAPAERRARRAAARRNIDDLTHDELKVALRRGNELANHHAERHGMCDTWEAIIRSINGDLGVNLFFERPQVTQTSGVFSLRVPDVGDQAAFQREAHAAVQEALAAVAARHEGATVDNALSNYNTQTQRRYR